MLSDYLILEGPDGESGLYSIGGLRRSGFPNMTDAAVLSHLNGSTRMAQLIGLACARMELGYESPLRDEYRHHVKNPFDSCHSNKTDLKAVSTWIFSNHRFVVTVGSKPLPVDSW